MGRNLCNRSLCTRVLYTYRKREIDFIPPGMGHLSQVGCQSGRHHDEYSRHLILGMRDITLWIAQFSYSDRYVKVIAYEPIFKTTTETKRRLDMDECIFYWQMTGREPWMERYNTSSFFCPQIMTSSAEKNASISVLVL
ncbi:MAG: hypothetical protein ACE5R6_16050 [Candidatus Heimdallarchaeota archaeon]